MATTKQNQPTYPLMIFHQKIENPRRRADALTAFKVLQEITGLSPYMWGPSLISFQGIRCTMCTNRSRGDMPAAAYSPRKTYMTFYVSN